MMTIGQQPARAPARGAARNGGRPARRRPPRRLGRGRAGRGQDAGLDLLLPQRLPPREVAAGDPGPRRQARAVADLLLRQLQSRPLQPVRAHLLGRGVPPGQADNAASPIYPDGTTLLLWHPQTQEAAVVRVNNAGPYWGERKLDVSRATAEKLGFKGRHGEARSRGGEGARAGRGQLPPQPQVRARAGPYRSLREREAARAGMTVVMALQAIASSVLAPITGGALFEADGGRAESNPAVAAADQPAASKPPRARARRRGAPAG